MVRLGIYVWRIETPNCSQCFVELLLLLTALNLLFPIPNSAAATYLTRPNHRPRTKTPTPTSTSTSTPTPTPVIGDGRGRDGLRHVSQSCERNSPGAVRACVPTCASQPPSGSTDQASLLSSPPLFSPSLLARPEQPPARSPQKTRPTTQPARTPV